MSIREKQIILTVIPSLHTKRRVNMERSINTFFKSIIGPNTKKPRIAGVGNSVLILRAITASEDEHNELRNAKAIIAIMATGVPYPCNHDGADDPVNARTLDATTIPIIM